MGVAGMANIKHIPEEKLIDYARGAIPMHEAGKIHSHLLYCQECYNTLQNWQQLLNNLEPKQPPAALKERIWNRLSVHQHERKTRKHPHIVLRSLLVAAIIGFIVGLGYFINGNRKTPPVAVNDEFRAMRLQQDPQTKQIHIVPVSSEYASINGNIWVNTRTKELLLEVEGLMQLSNHDHQVWIIYKDNEMIGALLPYQNGTSRLFFHDENVPELKMLKGSIEPKGGSKIPTGPDTFYVEIKE